MSGRSEQQNSSKLGCPICGKAVVAEFSPFCSARCADRDLGAWLKGGYVIPAAPDEGEAPPEKPGPDDDEPTTL